MRKVRFGRKALWHNRQRPVIRPPFQRILAGVTLEALGGRILCCNPAMARMLGYPDHAMVEGRPAESTFYDHADYERHRGAVLSKGSVTEEIRLRGASGAPVWVLA